MTQQATIPQGKLGKLVPTFTLGVIISPIYNGKGSISKYGIAVVSYNNFKHLICCEAFQAIGGKYRPRSPLHGEVGRIGPYRVIATAFDAVVE